MTPYTKEEDARLGKLLSQGYSYGDCAKILLAEGFPPRGRNALIGRAARKDLAPGKVVKRSPAVRPTKRSVQAIKVTTKPAAAIQAPAPALVPHPPARPATSPVHILDAKNGQCRYPLWPDYQRVPSSDLMVCGAATGPGKSWCGQCVKKVYSAAGEQERRHRRALAGAPAA